MLRVSGQLAITSRPPPRNPGSHSVVSECQDTLGETLVLCPHDDPFAGKF